ncbi:MAG: CCA tRNA nucleotidyltransferase [Clostridia bacterium]|nr:CCA tRNA nucleotidyltransferase [Clostridia bacterium]
MYAFDIPENITYVLDRLHSAGFESYIVGGCVRDSLLGIPAHDFDVTTNALPQEVIDVFSDMNVIETGIKHGTVTVVSGGENVEITTYRIDGEYLDNRRPSDVTFTRNIENDLSRRDFTVNAMAYSPHSGLVDLHGGVQDLDRKIIRCVGEPDRRFGEDGLRILRALRFSSVLGFSIDEQTSSSIHANSHLLKNISAERIFSEFAKLLCGRDAARICEEYSDVICRFIPELEESIGFPQINKYHLYDVYTHTLKALESSDCDRTVRLAVFFHDIGKPQAFDGEHFYSHPKISAQIAENVLRRLRADNETIRAVTLLVLFHDRHLEPTERSVKRLLRLMSFEDARRLLQVMRADILAHTDLVIDAELPKIPLIEDLINRIEQQNDCVSLKTLAVGGRELIDLGMSPGRKMGETLDALLDAVIDGDVANEREALLELAKTLINK